jgi:hypothetical protein
MNHLVKSYDYSSFITANDIELAIGDINKIIDSGNYFTNSPKFQTKENLFSLQGEHWLKFRMTFLTSVFSYFGQERQVGNMMAWCFKTNKSTEENRDSYWHHHNKHSGQSMSGIMYLHIPDDVTDLSTCGTEMAPLGPDGEGKFYAGPNDRTWNVYPSQTWHRPGPAQSDQWRYVLAVDIDYV